MALSGDPHIFCATQDPLIVNIYIITIIQKMKKPSSNTRQNLPTAENSLIIAIFGAVLTLLITQLASGFLSKNTVLATLGGFLSSLLCLFTLTIISNFFEKFLQRGRVQWGSTFFSVFVAFLVGTSIDGLSALTSILFSIVWIFLLSQVSETIYG
ncbi:MAG: hypothetical protein EZS28_020867 [Streblomastix strix]|uniref:Uncharacterized protein n=1 Tax=Streblomastix strix TaxID=222440 RepID=A0A5J4VME2_9EUKA|nr:MAG: hypothetical protein EZS28_020867 [Streblomastix strix]